MNKEARDELRRLAQSGTDDAEECLLHVAYDAIPALLDTIDGLEAALRDISNGSVPDQPASNGDDETTYVRRHVGKLRGIARAALAKLGHG